jgi:radical SAM superfamily enzyme YgiQ (UPF0313 family)
LNVALLAFDFVYPGIKMLSAALRAKGIQSSLIYLLPERYYDTSYAFTSQLKDNLAQLVSTYDLVGISVMTHNFHQAAALTRHLKAANQSIIIWGGIHPTIDPEGSLEYADGLALGEADESFTELVTSFAQGKDFTGTEGFWFKKGSSIVRNELRPPPRDLNSLPLPDIGYQGHFLRQSEEFVPLDKELLQKKYMESGLRSADGTFIPAYLTVFSRGCPFACTFCCNNRLAQLFGKERKKVRNRSLEKIFAEIQLARSIVPELGFVTIQDDNFLAQPVEYIENFSNRWSREVKLPLKISGSVKFINHERIGPLVDAGLMHIEIGLQSGSDRVNREIYKRRVAAADVLESARVLNEYKDRLLPAYDVLFDNPYETSCDRLETAKLVQQLPKPYAFSSFSLVFFPGTELYEKACRDELITDEKTQIFGKKTNDFNLSRVSYLKLMTLLMPSLPPKIGRVLIYKFWALFWDMPLWTPFFTWLARLLFWLRRNDLFRRANVSGLHKAESKIKDR